MRILDVSPRISALRERGSAVRIDGLLNGLGRGHEVRQFAQTVRSRLGAETAPRGYAELRFSSPLSDIAVELGQRAWTRAPILAGAGLRLTRPRVLKELLDWADVTLVEFPWQVEECRRLSPTGCLVYASHNVEARKFPSWSEAVGRPLSTRAWCRLVERLERKAVTESDLVIAVSEDDRAEFACRYGTDLERIVVIPNGADTTAYGPASDSEKAAAKRTLGLPNRPAVLFAGSDSPHNVAGIRWIERIARRTDRLTFLVAGGIGSWAQKGGTVVAPGFVEDFALCLRAADMSVCPIEHGGGTKIKLLESLSAGLPTVAFAESLHGLEIRDGEHVIVASKTEESLLAALQLLVDDPGIRAHLARKAREIAVERYDWGRIASALEAVLLGWLDELNRRDALRIDRRAHR